MIRAMLCSLTALLLILIGFPVQAQEGGSTYYDLGVFAYEDGDYKKAEINFKKALTADPSNPSFNHYMGKTYIKLEKFGEAAKYIDAAWRIDPDLPDLSYDRAFLFYRLENYQEAATLFEGVLQEDPARILANFFGGISLYRDKQYQKANQYLMAAAEKSPDLKVKSTYYSGLCHYHMGQNAQAVEKLTYVKTHTDSDDVRDNTNRWLAMIQSGKKEQKPYEIQAKLAYEYDDNVPVDPTAKGDIYSGESDSLILGYASGEYNFIDQETFILGAGISRFQTWYFELDESNMSETAFKLSGNYFADPFTYGLRIRPSIFQVDAEDYLLTYEFKPEVSYELNKQVLLWLSYSYAIDDYRQDTEDDRDGDTHGIFFDTIYSLGGEKGYVLGGIGYEANAASEGEYDYGEFALRVGGSYELDFDLRLGAFGTYSGRSYGDKDALEDKKREDTLYRITLSLARTFFYDWLEIALEYTYTKNDSNIDTYEYDRQVFGFGLAATY